MNEAYQTAIRKLKTSLYEPLHIVTVRKART